MHSLYDPVSAIIRRAASEIVMPWFQKLSAMDIAEKSPGDPVTIADKRSEDLIGKAIQNIDSTAIIVGEEACEANPCLREALHDQRCWLIDPIDGTANYAAGHGPFAIIIALVENGETQAGWLYDPVQNRMCHAVRYGGAFINGHTATAQACAGTSPIAALATGYMPADQRTRILEAAKGIYKIVDIPRCAAEQYPRLVSGQNHISLFERTLPWDHAAGVLFLNEAGGKAARPDGTAYRPASHETGLIGASSPELWVQARDVFYGQG